MPLRYSLLVFASLLWAPSVLGQGMASQDLGVLRVALASRLAEIDPEQLTVEHTVPVGRSGARVLHVVQSLGGVPIRGTETVVAVDVAGTPRYVRGTLRGGLGEMPAQVPLVTAATAGRSAAARSGDAPLSTDAVYVQQDGALRLAWESVVPDGDHTWLVHTDARTGAEIGRRDLTVYDRWEASPGNMSDSRRPTPALDPLEPVAGAGGQDVYRVFAAPVKSPLHTPEGPFIDSRTLAEGPADALASPFGWHDDDGLAGDEYDVSLGNNIWAYADSDNDNTYDLGDAVAGVRIAGGLVFDDPLDLTASPGTSRDAALTNAFYWANHAHDVLWHAGFDEASGNFQTNTYGRGGVGGDAMLLEVLDGRTVNSATYSPRSEGNPGRIQLSEFTLTAPTRDPSFDAAIIVHEYAHGLSTRLIGGSSATGCLNNQEQMGEGWSDWYGLMLTMDAADERVDPRGIGAYVLGGAPGTTFRPAPYSTSFALNNYTHARIRELSGPHSIGFVWATILWEATWELIGAHGFDPDLHNGDGRAGNQVMLRLVTEALKMTPCQPGFVDGRDAILAADALLFPVPGDPNIGQHTELLWDAFRRRGLGGGAFQGDPDSRFDNVDSFGPPADAGSAYVDARSISIEAPLGDVWEHVVRVRNLSVSGDAILAVSVLAQGPDGVPPWLSILPSSVGLAAGEARDVLLRIDPEKMDLGRRYSAVLTFVTNDVLLPEVPVPLDVMVPYPPADGLVIPRDLISSRLEVGEFVERTITVTNVALPGTSAPSVTVRGALPNGEAPGWMSISPTAFSIAPGASQDVTLVFGGEDILLAEYRAVVRFNSLSGQYVPVPVELAVVSEIVQRGSAGWRFMAFPHQGVVARDLAAMNLVQGIEGFYPDAPANLIVGYNGTAGVPLALGRAIQVGTGTWWYLFDEDRDPGGASVSHALPHTLGFPNRRVADSQNILMFGTEGSFFALGNPYDDAIDISLIPTQDSDGDAFRSSVFQMWDPEARTYETSLTQPTVPAWQGFLVEVDKPSRLRIPMSARRPEGVVREASAAPLVGFELAEAAGSLRDRAAIVRFQDGARDGRDRFDAAKLDPFGDAGLTLTVIGSDGELRAVESRPMPDAAAVISLGVAARGSSSDLVLRWPYLESLPADWAVRLFDVETGTSIDMLTEDDYRFSVEPAAARDPLAIGTRLQGTQKPRFKLLAGPASTLPSDADLAPVLSLGTPYPNPSRGSARVRFSLAEAGPARLTLLDALGRQVAVLTDATRDAGEHQVSLDGAGLAVGVYVLRLEAGGEVQLTRVTIAR